MSLPAERDDEEGFTLIEIMVAMGLFLLVVVSTYPLLIGGLKASSLARANLQGKALGQERLERLRNLPFHVDQQNGLYIDLLDTYFRDATPGTGTLASGDACSGRSYDATTFTYTCTLDDTRLGAPYANFRQTVESQFIKADRTVVTVPTTYNSQSATYDSPVSNLLSVVITTTWSVGGRTKSFVVRSQIVNAASTGTTVESGISVEPLSISSTTTAGDTLRFDGGLVNTTGSLTDASTVTLIGTAAQAALSSGASATGASVAASAPTAAGSPAAPTPDTGSKMLEGTCVLVCFDTSSVGGDQTVAVTNGLPQVSRSNNPFTVALNHGSNGFTYNNVALAQPSPPVSPPVPVADPALLLVGSMVSGVASGGQAFSSSAYLDSSGIGTTSITNGAASSLSMLTLFPTTFAPNGVVRVQLSNEQLGCRAGGGSSSVTTATWTGKVDYWGADGSYHSIDLKPGGTALPDPSTTFVQSGVPLSRYVAAWTALTSASNVPVATGLATQAKGSIPAVLTITTGPTRASDPTSPISLVMGAMSCNAKDAR